MREGLIFARSAALRARPLARSEERFIHSTARGCAASRRIHTVNNSGDNLNPLWNAARTSASSGSPNAALPGDVLAMRVSPGGRNEPGRRTTASV